MKVLLGIQYFYPYTNGGTELYVYDLAKALIANGNEVAILKIGKEKDYNYDGIKVFVLPEGDFNHILSDREYTILTQFNKVLDEFAPEVFHLNTLHEKLNGLFFKETQKSGILNVYTNHLANTTCAKGDLLLMGNEPCDGRFGYKRCFKCILSVNNSTLTPFSNLILTFDKYTSILQKKSAALRTLHQTNHQIQLLNAYSDLLFVQSNWQYEVLLRNRFDPERLHLIRLGIEHIRRSPANVKPRDKKAFGFIGRYSPNKGIHVLIRALHKITSPLNLFFCISINENEIAEFENLFGTLKKNHHVHIRYNAARAEVIDVLDTITALIVPSLVAETGPYVVLEALSRNTPVIGSDIGAIPEMIIHNVNGLLFKPGKVNALYKAIKHFIAHPITLLNTNKFPVRIHSTKQYASEIESLYKRVLKSR
ncbi:glycosyltransferase [Pedobacter sp. AW1-32]|uniref:glycosyltransferase n=1 Tax=Pedobacter sp. AW1-32 TaxID=3383026 RepID=UPI003FEEF8D1